MMGGYGFGGMGYGGAGFLWPILQIGIIIAVVYLIVQLVKKPNSQKHSNDNAITILDSRYVKGELSDEEYERMKRTLKSNK